jgi:hypothetical protein
MIRMAYAVPFWYSKKDRISDEACDEIIRLGKENGLDKAGIYGATGTSQKSDKNCEHQMYRGLRKDIS